ncbi:hypothetical protein ABH922_003797 [Rhodococcus sp. 27YEA15]
MASKTHRGRGITAVTIGVFAALTLTGCAGTSAAGDAPSTNVGSGVGVGVTPSVSAGSGVGVGVTPSSAPTVPTHTSATSDLLAQIPIKGRAPKTGYDRALFGPAWTDAVDVEFGRNGCDTRNDILRRDLTDLVVKDGAKACTILSGTLHDPYTGKTINFTRGQDTSTAVQIDHVVALSDAWQKGAQQLDTQTRTNLANDPRNLRAVDGPTNQKKSDSDAASWLPPNRSYRCEYVSAQVEVKAAYGLWMTQAEHDAIAAILESC